MKTIRLYLVAMALIFTFVSISAFSQENNEEITNNSAVSKYGPDSAQCVTNLSLYRDFYKQWKDSKSTNNELAESAYATWGYCFRSCPAVSMNMYNHGADLLKNYKIKNEKDSIIRQKYVDTLILLYQKRIEFFGSHPIYNIGYLKGRMAVEIYTYRDNQSTVYYPLFKESVDMQLNKSEAAILMKFFGASYKYYKQGNAPIDVVLENYLEILDILDHNTMTGQKDSADYAAVNTNMEKSVKDLFKCEKLIEILGPKFKADPNNMDLSRKIVRIFEVRKCTDLDLYYEALANVHSKSPSAESAFSMGKMSLNRQKWDKAKVYLQEAAESFPDTLPDKIANSYLLLAEAQRKLGAFSAARTAAYNALKYRPSEAQAYIIIGDLYMASAGDCKFKDMYTAYWAAADKYAQALNLTNDEKIKAMAQERLNDARRRFPAEQDIFMRNLTVGQNFTIECWIGETTTVRSK